MKTFKLYLLSLPLLLGGCAMKEFSSTPLYTGDEVKFTGAVEDRVNLWPLYYHRAPVSSVAWPFVSWGDDHFALRPLYSKYRQAGSEDYDEFNYLWPIGQFDAKRGEYRAFPFFWGNGEFIAFPALWFTKDTTAVLPLVMNEAGTRGTLFPLVWWKSEKGVDFSAAYPLYSAETNPDETRFWALAGLCGRYRSRAGQFTHWVLPAYLSNNKGVFTVPYSHMEGTDGVKTRAFLCGLAGWSTTNGMYRSSWTVPFHYDDGERFLTPLYGRSADRDWIMPVYYREGRSVYTPLYCDMEDANTGERTLLSIPLLVGASWATNSCKRSWTALAGLVGANSSASGERREQWAYPFFRRDVGRSFMTLPYGWYGGGTAKTNTWWATPLVGTRSGAVSGWWAFPFCDHGKDADFDLRLSQFGADTLPDDISTSSHFHAEDETTYALISDDNLGIAGNLVRWGDTNRYVVTLRRKVGNMLLWNDETLQRVDYDATTRGKVVDREQRESSLLMFLYRGMRKTDAMSGETRSQHQVLWRLWNREERNGDVSLDVFPGFTYDSRSNGYSKASLFWRLFRYERDPDAGTFIDLLFLPVWRGN